MSDKKKELTPVMKQYISIKEEYQDTILLYRMGDFYELFFEDAVEGAKILQIALTSRDRKKDNPIPMCGFPYHAAENYIRKLLEAGKKVAVCEQVEDPKLAKKIVKREVVKVLTPGTALEFDNQKENIFIASVFLNNYDWGIFIIDISTGEAFCTEENQDIGFKRLVRELDNFTPKEIIISEDEEGNFYDILEKLSYTDIILNTIEEWYFTYESGIKEIKQNFNVSTLEGFGISEKEMILSAAGGVFRYIRKIRKESLPEFKSIRNYGKNDFMVLDSITQSTLEIFKESRYKRKEGSLFGILDKTQTSMGSRTLKEWLMHPLLSPEQIKKRLDGVEELTKKTIFREDLKDKIKNIYDLDRLSSKISSRTANPKDLISLRNSIETLPEIKLYMKQGESEILKELFALVDPLDDLKGFIDKAIEENPSNTITDGGIIRKGYNEELDKLREIAFSGKEYIAQLEEKEKKRTGINTLRVGFNKIFGFYIEISKAAARDKELPEDYIRKQTLVNSERYISQELKEYEQMVMGAEEKIKKIEYELFIEIRDKIKKDIKRIMRTSKAIATLDVLLSLASVAVKYGYNRPMIYDGDTIEIIEGRHPVVEIVNNSSFVPNDAILDTRENQIIILTGPNMGGKSTFLRQVAIINLMAQIGSFVPASIAKIGITDRIFTRIGASDYLGGGQSTFMVEMIETAHILQNASSKSLVLLDEIGRGTSTYDGMAIAWSVIEYLHSNGKIRPKTLFATHYHQLTMIEDYLKRVKNYHMTVKKGKKGIVFLYKVYKGPSDESFGIEVAKLAGIPKDVIERAKNLLFNMEKRDNILQYKKKNDTLNEQRLLFSPKKGEKDCPEYEKIKKELTKLNISEMTPIEALNFLNDLKKRVKS
jgi:DNA mismatch repair protein MutS